MSEKKYGLILPGKKAEKKTLLPSVFGNESDDEAEEGPASVNRRIQEEARKNLTKKETQVQIETALAEDPTIFDYDAVYDDLKETKKLSDAKLKNKLDTKPKYIEKLMNTAEKRKKEYERRVERKVQKEREKEAGMFDDKEAFVTSAYKEKMQRIQAEEEEERRKERLEDAMEVTKQRDLSGFYRHFLNQQVCEETVGERAKQDNVEQWKKTDIKKEDESKPLRDVERQDSKSSIELEKQQSVGSSEEKQSKRREFRRQRLSSGSNPENTQTQSHRKQLDSSASSDDGEDESKDRNKQVARRQDKKKDRLHLRQRKSSSSSRDSEEEEYQKQKYNKDRQREKEKHKYTGREKGRREERKHHDDKDQYWREDKNEKYQANKGKDRCDNSHDHRREKRQEKNYATEKFGEKEKEESGSKKKGRYSSGTRISSSEDERKDDQHLQIDGNREETDGKVAQKSVPKNTPKMSKKDLPYSQRFPKRTVGEKFDDAKLRYLMRRQNLLPALVKD